MRHPLGTRLEPGWHNRTRLHGRCVQSGRKCRREHSLHSCLIPNTGQVRIQANSLRFLAKFARKRFFGCVVMPSAEAASVLDRDAVPRFGDTKTQAFGAILHIAHIAIPIASIGTYFPERDA